MVIDGSWYRRPPDVGEHESAGGVVVRAGGEGILVALLHEGGRLAYTLPKGHLEPGEGAEEAARREIAEEAGLRDLVLLGRLGTRERLNFERTSWKKTHYFLFLTTQPDARGAEYGVEWFPLDRLPGMFWPEQRGLLESAAEQIRAAVTRHQVRRQFDRQAEAYARSTSHAAERDLDLLVEHLRLRPTDRVLDVATGTGFTAFALREHAAQVVGLDLTPGMLRAARRLSRRSIHWIAGDAQALPFAPEVFDAVTVRRAPHHFPSIAGAVREMLRVLRRGGRIGIVDQVPPEDDAGRALMEHLEKLRDPSHVEALTARRWRALVDGLGVEVAFADVVERPQSLETWLQLAGADPSRRKSIQDALAAATPAARLEIGDDGSEPLSFMKRWGVLVGVKR